MSIKEWVIRLPKNKDKNYTYVVGVDGVVVLFESSNHAEAFKKMGKNNETYEIISLEQAKQEDPLLVLTIGSQLAKTISKAVKEELDKLFPDFVPELIETDDIINTPADINSAGMQDGQWCIARYGPLEEDGVSLWGIWSAQDEFQIIPNKTFADKICRKFRVSDNSCEFRVIPFEDSFELLSTQPTVEEWEEQHAPWSIEDLLNELERE
tara:strand:- start:313 stop:942 length:630 start_codon:yes stop_codon:yes gene_type:complete